MAKQGSSGIAYMYWFDCEKQINDFENKGMY